MASIDSPQLPDAMDVSATLPAPWLKDFPGAVIDPDQVTGATQVLVGAYTGKAVDDRIILFVNGDNHSTFAYLMVHSGNLGQDIAFTIAKTPYIEGNSRVDVHYIVQRANGSSDSSEVLPVTIRAGESWPAITDLRDSRGSVPHGQSTTDSNVTLVGTASPGRQVQILHNSIPGQTVNVDANGNWNSTGLALSIGWHVFEAKALYGAGQVSVNREVTRVAALSIDSSTAVISGMHLYLDANYPPPWRRTSYTPDGTTLTRQATGGIGNIVYSSANSRIAEVNASTGRVTSVANGQTTIVARDAAGAQVSYPVRCSRVYSIIAHPPGQTFTYHEARAWVLSDARNSVFDPVQTEFGREMFECLHHSFVGGADAQHHTGAYLASNPYETSVWWAQPEAPVDYLGPVSMEARFGASGYRPKQP